MAEPLIPLTDAEWPQREDLARLAAALGPGNARWVGGAVRDALIGTAAKDVDCATPLPPQEVMQRLQDAGIRTVPTGIAHGTITAVLSQGPVEVTTLRRDVSTDGRRATVAFATDWRADAARRDFTINALYADPSTLEVFDYFGGLDDLASRRVRFIGDARQRIREDHLRILRYYRFQARLGADLDREAEDACAELAPMLKGLSRERVAMELLSLLGLPDPCATIARMRARGILAVVLPEIDEHGLIALKAVVLQEQKQGAAPAAIRRLAALLPPDPRTADQVAARLRLSGAQKKRLVCAADREGDPGDARALAYRLGREQAVDRLLLTGQDIAPLSGWEVPALPMKGGEIVARGVKAGPDVARTLRLIERRWIAEGFPARERTLAIMEEILDENR